MVSSPDQQLNAARGAIAAACLDPLPSATLGEISLRDEQRLVVARARRAIAAHGGVLVADDVGRGKTFVALALARGWPRRLIVIPSALRDAWNVAMRRADVPCDVTTHDALSRGHRPVPGEHDVIIVDESHHFRTPGIRRYEALTSLAARTPLVLLSATPLQNRVRDLAAQLALFLGAAAFELDLEQLGRHIIRGVDQVNSVIPRLAPPEWLDIGVDDESVLEAVLELPDPVRPRDSGDEGALRTIALVRAWASSRAALRNTLRRRRRIATALEQGLADGVLPSRAEARSWLAVDDAVQLGLTPLLVNADVRMDYTTLLSALADERRALDELSKQLRCTPDPDLARVNALRRLRAPEPSARLLVFSEFASTVAALYSALRLDPGVGMLTSKDARIASGRITRRELLARFAPVAQHGAAYRRHEQLTLLLTTDLLSEGLDLQDASVVVHLDLPWNPARLVQRVGRVLRPGGAACVTNLLLAPPARAATLLGVESRLRTKAALARAATGSQADVLPVLSAERLATLVSPEPPGLSAGERGAIMARLTRWNCAAYQRGDLAIAAVDWPTRAWLACLDDGALATTLPSTRGSEHALVSAIAALEHAPRFADAIERDTAIAEIQKWMNALRASNVSGMTQCEGPLRRDAIFRLHMLAHVVPRQSRAELLPLIAALCGRLRSALPLGAERNLLRDIHALASVADLGKHLRSVLRDLPARTTTPSTSERLIAVVLLGPRGSQMHHGASHSADPVMLRW
jgi:hypothetical protein